MTLAVPVPQRGIAWPYRVKLTAEHADPVTVEGAIKVAPPDTLSGVTT